MKRLLSPWTLVVAGGLLVAAALVLFVWPSERYIFLPDSARAVEPHVTVAGERPDSDGGGIYFVAVDVRKASLLERLFPGIQEGATVVPASQVGPRCVSAKERREGELREMRQSQRDAAAVALRALGHHVEIKKTGALITGVDCNLPAGAKLRPTQIVIEADGELVRTPRDLRRVIRRHSPGETVRLKIRDGPRTRDVVVGTARDPRNPGSPLIGVYPAQSANVKLPFKVEVELEDVGGPSAGLAFALDLMEELGRDVDRGYKVAATGAIELDGTVVAVGGVKQKAIAARRSKMDVFLVPAGENAREARKHGKGLRVLPIRSFEHALRALKALPPKGATSTA